MNILHHSLLIYLLNAVHCYVNVALNKPAHQQTPLVQNGSKYDARNAVDGKKSDLSRNGGQCAVSSGGVTATWLVNLTSVYSIHHITIYYLTDNIPWDSSNRNAESFLGFSVYVSNTTDRFQGNLCFRDNNFTLGAFPAVFTFFCHEVGQYVIYYNERLPDETYPAHVSQYADNNLCEVEAYGCPSNGCYGSNHSYPCPDVNCQYCHTETGTCQVCEPGYKGQKCEQECDAGTYGINCSKTCGSCHQSRCHNINGSCSDGCSAGYKGPLCTDQCDTETYGINCLKICGNCGNRSRCHNVNGSCSDGCSAGYRGPLCTDLDKYVLFLTSSVLKRGNYINAISLQSFTSQEAFIITRYPTKGDAVYLIGLITDYESEVVVSMEPFCNIESRLFLHKRKYFGENSTKSAPFWTDFKSLWEEIEKDNRPQKWERLEDVDRRRTERARGKETW